MKIVPLRSLVMAALLLLLCAPAWPQRDPLTRTEADQLRESAQEPVRRLRLLLEFTQSRMAAIELLRSDARLAPGRGEKIRGLLGDFGRLVDELDANIDMFAEREESLRRPLREIVEATSGWQLKLRALRESPGAGGSPEELSAYEFTLEDAVDAVNVTAETARHALEEESRREQERRDARKKRRR